MRIIIIGAGITGLYAAYLFAQKGHEVQVFERHSDVGGLAGCFKVNDTYLEKYYHHSFSSHKELLRLMKALNKETHFFETSVKAGIYYRGDILPFVSAKDLVNFTPLKLRNRIRLGLTTLLMMRVKNWQKLEEKSALEWLRFYSGDESCKIIWEPLLKMKFGDDFNRISAAWLWNRVVDRKGVQKSKDILGYINGSYKIIFDALIKNITRLGGKIETNLPIEQINISDGKCTGVRVNSIQHEADMVLSTVSLPSFLKLTSFLPQEYVDTLSSIKYQGSVCVVLKLKTALSKYYWINVSDPNSPFVGIIEHTNFISPEQYGNRHLVYLSRYSFSEDPIFSRADTIIYKEFINYLMRIFPRFSEHDIEKYWVFKDRFSQPVFVRNYSKIMPPASTPIKDLYMLNTAQIYPQSRSVNSSIAKVHKVIGEILSNNDK